MCTSCDIIYRGAGTAPRTTPARRRPDACTGGAAARRAGAPCNGATRAGNTSGRPPRPNARPNQDDAGRDTAASQTARPRDPCGSASSSLRGTCRSKRTGCRESRCRNPRRGGPPGKSQSDPHRSNHTCRTDACNTDPCRDVADDDATSETNARPEAKLAKKFATYCCVCLCLLFFFSILLDEWRLLCCRAPLCRAPLC